LRLKLPHTINKSTPQIRVAPKCLNHNLLTLWTSFDLLLEIQNSISERQLQAKLNLPRRPGARSFSVTAVVEVRAIRDQRGNGCENREKKITNKQGPHLVAAQNDIDYPLATISLTAASGLGQVILFILQDAHVGGVSKDQRSFFHTLNSGSILRATERGRNISAFIDAPTQVKIFARELQRPNPFHQNVSFTPS